MMYTLDLSGHTADGNARINRFGGLFLSVEDTIAHGEQAAQSARLAFNPEIVWVRDEAGEVICQKKLG